MFTLRTATQGTIDDITIKKNFQKDKNAGFSSKLQFLLIGP